LAQKFADCSIPQWAKHRQIHRTQSQVEPDIFDYCQNLEYFSQNPETTNGRVGDSLSKQLFTARLNLLSQLNQQKNPTLRAGEEPATYGTFGLKAPKTNLDVRQAIAAQLQSAVAAMNLDNFIVRPQRQLVETYAQLTPWQTLRPEKVGELAEQLAGLPTELPSEPEAAKRFDLLMLRLQVAVLQPQPDLTPLSPRIQAIAAGLEEKGSIPAVQKQMELIQDIQTEVWWENITIPILERTRQHLRALMHLVEKTQRPILYTDFTDELGPEAWFDLPGLDSGTEFDRFRAKARQFLLAHANHITIHKLKFNQPLTPSDLDELEQMLMESGISHPEQLQTVKQTGLGLFIRSLVGLDREAAKLAFSEFLSGFTASANQIEFINLIIDHLMRHGVMDVGTLYESPFTDINSQGPEGVFTPTQLEALTSVLDKIRATAAA
jgi:type I restriction enzyme, R subunit